MKSGKKTRLTHAEGWHNVRMSRDLKYFVDNYVGEPYDLSKVMFICTANYIENIPLELLDRLEIIEISSYTESEKLSIAKNYLIKKVLNDLNIPSDIIKFNDKAILKIIRNYTFTRKFVVKPIMQLRK